ncbi:MAG TPA: ABC transporter permease [Candidatus Methanoperedenaceae archaeon]|nr:ABC transporter permease [Candidatus Methanoperedenaceae archaeon]
MLDLIIRNLAQRKMRTGLTIFGIMLGIFAVVVMGGMSENMNSVVDKSVILMANNIQVQPEGTNVLDESKIRQIKRVPGVKDAFGILSQLVDPEQTGGVGIPDLVFGLPPENQMKEAKLSSGRYLVPGDGYNAVVGYGIAKKFDLSVGDELDLKKKSSGRSSSITQSRNVTVVGILEYTGTVFDYVVQMPLDRAQKFYGMENKVSIIHAVPEYGTDPEDLARRIELSVEGVKTDSPGELKKKFKDNLALFSMITVSAAVLAAIIGGLSVMNTMLMSVSERTKEFGIMKALGAERKSILLMTMGEAALMGFAGGNLGIAAGGVIIRVLNESNGTPMFALTPKLVLIALLFAVILGVTCGTYPAYRATKMSPMEALRNE